jgi:uncharacterized protein
MTKPVFVIHGAGMPAFRRGDVYWKSLLGDALGSSHRVTSPLVPDPENPTYPNWAGVIARSLDGHDPLTLVGHSLGASLILKYLSENRTTREITGLFLVSTPHWGAPDGKMAEFALAPDFADRLPKVPIYLYQSEADTVVPIEHLRTYAKALPHAHVRILPGSRHDFADGLFPELPEDIRTVNGS